MGPSDTDTHRPLSTPPPSQRDLVDVSLLSGGSLRSLSVPRLLLFGSLGHVPLSHSVPVSVDALDHESSVLPRPLRTDE